MATTGDSKSLMAWWNIVIASTAVAIGCGLFIGHEALHQRLLDLFGYRSTPFSIYSYDEVLMFGVDTIFRVLAPRFVPVLLVVVIAKKILSLRVWRVVVFVVGTPLLVLMLLTPTELGPTSRNVMSEHQNVSMMLVFFAAIILTVESTWGKSQWPKGASIGAFFVIWAFVMWLAPRIMSPLKYDCLPIAHVRLKDGQVKRYYFLTQRNDMLVLGETLSGGVVFLPSSNLEQLNLEQCP